MLMNMTEILRVAEEQKFAVPAFNIGSGVILNGVMDTCERLNAPVILAIHPSELAFMGDSFIEMCKDRANKSSVPVCIHLDHSGFDPILRALRTGFTSVMIDASHLSFEENIAITKKVCELAHPLGVSVEELIAQYPDSLLLPGDHFVREAASCHPANAIANYKKAHNLNFDQLADLLGLAARECARVVCRPVVANAEHVATLAALHGISCKEFQRRYVGSDAA